MRHFSSFLILLLTLTSSLLLKQVEAGADDYHDIFVIVQFNSVSTINGNDQTFVADFYVNYLWQDKDVRDGSYTIDTSKDFIPQIAIINARSDTVSFFLDDSKAYFTSSKAPFQLQGIGIKESNNHLWFGYRNRVVATFQTPLNFRDFPFDRQLLRVGFESYTSNNASLKLHWGTNSTLYSSILPPADGTVGWTLNGVSFLTVNRFYSARSNSYAHLEVVLAYTRQADFYIYKIVLGTVLLVLMDIWLTSLQVDEPDRQAATISVYGGLVAFLFVTTADVPKVAYQTRLDVFLAFCFFMVFIIMFYNGLIYFFRERDEPEEEESDAQSPSISKKSSPPKPGFLGWWNSLVFTRKFDVAFMSSMATLFAFGIIFIFNRPLKGASNEFEKLPAYVFNNATYNQFFANN